MKRMSLHILLMVFLTAVLAACPSPSTTTPDAGLTMEPSTPSAATEEDEEATESESITETDGITMTPGLTMTEEMTETDGITMTPGLTMTEEMTETNGITTPEN